MTVQTFAAIRLKHGAKLQVPAIRKKRKPQPPANKGKEKSAKSKASQSQTKPNSKKATVKSKPCQEISSLAISSSNSTVVRSSPIDASAAESRRVEKEARELVAKRRREKMETDRDSKEKQEPRVRVVSLKLPPSTARPSANGKDIVAPLEGARTPAAVQVQQMENIEAGSSAATSVAGGGKETNAVKLLENKGSDERLASKVAKGSGPLSEAVSAPSGTQNEATKTCESQVDAEDGKTGDCPGKGKRVAERDKEVEEGIEDEERRPKKFKGAPDKELAKVQELNNMESAQNGATKSGRSEEVNLSSPEKLDLDTEAGGRKRGRPRKEGNFSEEDLETGDATRGGSRKRGRPKKVRAEPEEELGKVEKTKNDGGGEVHFVQGESIELSSCTKPPEAIIEIKADKASKEEEDPSKCLEKPQGNEDGLPGQEVQPPQKKEGQDRPPTKMTPTPNGWPKVGPNRMKRELANLGLLAGGRHVKRMKESKTRLRNLRH